MWLYGEILYMFSLYYDTATDLRSEELGNWLVIIDMAWKKGRMIYLTDASGDAAIYYEQYCTLVAKPYPELARAISRTVMYILEMSPLLCVQ